MSDHMRWRYGDSNPVLAAVDSATVINIGDLLWLDDDDAKPASMIGPAAWEPGHRIFRLSFARQFLGVAMQGSPAGDSNPIRVATTGVFEYKCPSGTFELGDLIGVDVVDVNAAGVLLPQQVAKVAASKYAIARVAKRIPAAATSVFVDIRSTVMTGGVEGSSREGV